jgi:lipoprotein-anchoring transpeptidase ErfK/SrfK
LVAGAAPTEARRPQPADALAAAAAGLPRPPDPAFVPKVTGSGPLAPAARWAPVLRAVVARAEPASAARAVTRLETQTPEETTNIVLALGDRDVDGRIWVHVRLAILPNGSTGWIPRDAIGGYTTVHTRLVVDLDRLQATLFRDGRPVFRAPIGIGRSQWPTPRGNFYVRDRLTSLDPRVYGPIAFGTSARSSVLTDWPAGGYVGIHGTGDPGVLPGRVSHGCIRMRNDRILELARLMPVGTPLTIR